MEHILYILPLRDKTAFKVGITSNNDLNRIKQLHSLYDFNLNESFIVKSSTKNINLLEKQLLTDYSFYKHILEEKSDGHTEFLKYECISNILDDINHKIKKPHINISINKGIKLCDIIKEPVLSKQKPKIKNPKLPLSFDDINFYDLYKFLEIVEENKDRIKLEIEIKEKDNITGERVILHISDIDIIQKLYDYRLIEDRNKNCRFAYIFVDFCEYDKVNKVGKIQLGGTYDKFDNEKRFDNFYVYTEYTNMLKKLKQICQIIN